MGEIVRESREQSQQGERGEKTWALTAGHLLLVWFFGSAVAPALGFAIVGAGWGGGMPAALITLLVGGPVAVAALAALGRLARGMVPLCATTGGLIGWAVTVFAGGTLGAIAGAAAWTTEEFGRGSAEVLIPLSGIPYALTAAFFVPGRAVRLTSAAALAGTLAFAAYTLHQARERDTLNELLAGDPLSREQRLLIDPPGDYEFEEDSGTLGPTDFRVHFTAGGGQGASPGFPYQVTERRDGDCPEDLPGRISCEDVGDGFTVVTQRHDDGDVWSYVHLRRGGLLLAARTAPGLGVPELRAALAAARPATDDELLRVLRE
ncbi:hypothetical protein OG883_30520 [Streptomyces sp. NBC_01142]|uniref:hypothetical protein n=1 Tax=Streptomyces sp. NBC_01142 TaxID=2975865 RepID=UPI00224E18C5|nr:hypothetical protein [Streptomyces sp. NBC_01142]MCX4824126.1 hypothetical protein [Streptomyces sp. NBC_01142]